MEKLFESGLWGSRFIVLLAVIFGLIGAIVLFAVASIDIYDGKPVRTQGLWKKKTQSMNN